jgi:hypothetical protein
MGTFTFVVFRKLLRSERQNIYLISSYFKVASPGGIF